ncbi:MAG: HAMP domain-containing histidine kinase, partial [Flavobacteriaceae bacterium]|nr:HAMP domain-containing histidine kinase [Flavobacteriaceae bacterium]
MLPIEFGSFSQKMIGVLFAMLMNTVFLLASHYVLKQKGGWVGIKDSSYLDEQKIIRREKWAALVSKARNFNPINYIKALPVADDSRYVTLGAYFLVFTFTSIYSTHAEMLKANKAIITTIYKTMIISSTMMGMYLIWPLSIKTEIKQMVMRVWYPLAIFYMLIFFSIFFVLLNKDNNLHFVLFAVNMIVSIVLLGWQMASVMIVVGMYMAVQFYKYYAGIEYLDISLGSPQFILLYSLVFIGAALVIFFRPQQERQKQTEHKVGELLDEVGTLVTVVSSRDSQISTLDTKVSGLEERVDHYTERTTNQAQEIERLGSTAQRILNNVNHELRLPVGNVMNFAEILHDGLGKLSDEQLKMLSKEVYKNSNRLSTMILNMLDLATLQAKKIELQIKLANFSELVEERLAACRKIYVEEKPLKFIIKIEKNVMVPMDENYIRQTIDNLVINAINFSEKG